MISYEGVVCVLKPPGMSSSDAVTDLRRIFGEKRVGHTGTLDPAAAGVLPICIGRAARLFDFLVDKQKTYIAEIVFGAATDTEDATGKIVDSSNRVIEQTELEAVLPCFIGDIEQTPPAYSALNVNGVKLYKLARKGQLTEAPEIKKRTVSIFDLSIIEKTDTNRYLIRIVCSKGTYIRTLCKDIGLALDMPAHMSFLLRTASGSFGIDDCYSISELEALKAAGKLGDVVIPMDKAIAHIPELRLEGLSDKKLDLLIKGTALKAECQTEDVPLRVYANGDFIGLGTVNGGELKLTVWLGDEARQVKGAKISGTVGENKHIGSELGFPTANLFGVNKKLLPPEGVYVTVAEIGNERMRAVTSIGRNPTFGANELTVETHIIDYSGDCYGKKMTVIFVKWIRPMQRFDSVSKLKERIAKDVEISKSCKDSLKYTENY